MASTTSTDPLVANAEIGQLADVALDADVGLDGLLAELGDPRPVGVDRQRLGTSHGERDGVALRRHPELERPLAIAHVATQMQLVVTGKVSPEHDTGVAVGTHGHPVWSGRRAGARMLGNFDSSPTADRDWLPLRA